MIFVDYLYEYFILGFHLFRMTIFVRVIVETFLASGRTKIKRLSLMLRLELRVLFIHCHSAHRIFHHFFIPPLVRVWNRNYLRLHLYICKVFISRRVITITIIRK